jgi:hypothetical protein
MDHKQYKVPRSSRDGWLRGQNDVVGPAVYRLSVLDTPARIQGIILELQYI